VNEAAGIISRAATRERFTGSMAGPRPTRTDIQTTTKQHQRREDMQAYCVKCKEKREVKDPVAVTMKNGKPATQGTCSVCGTKMFKIGKS